MKDSCNNTRVQWAVAILLAMIAGYLDGYGLFFLKVKHILTSRVRVSKRLYDLGFSGALFSPESRVQTYGRGCSYLHVSS